MTLPKGWTQAKISDIASLNPKHPPETDISQIISFVPMPSVDEHLGAITDAVDRELREVWTGYTHFADGDVIFAKITPCMENGKAAVASGLTNGLGCGSTEFFVFRPRENISPYYLWRFLRQDSFRSLAETQMTGAVGQRRVPRSFLEDSVIPLPPTAEQRRIVAKLDLLSARIAQAREELQRIANLTKRMRDQVLVDAVSGLLIASIPAVEWTAEQKAAIEERRLKYAAARRGSRLRQDIGKKISMLSDNRSGWLNCRLADVVDLRVGYAFKSSDFSERGISLLRGVNVAPGKIDWGDKVFLPRTIASLYEKYLLTVGDIVIAMDRPIISSGLKVSRVSTDDAGSLLVQRVANPLPSEYILPEYLYIILCSKLFIGQIEGHATGSDLPHISANDILMTPCPLPPLNVQHSIVRLVDAVFDRADLLEAEASRARSLLDRLESAILAKAFQGELVPQDPNDEPASVLLDRIRAGRAAAPKPKRGRRATAA